MALYKKYIGLHIKQARKDKKLTQLDLAKLIGKTTSTVQKYENGVIEVPFSVLEQIGDALGVGWVGLVPMTIDEFEKEVHEKDKLKTKELAVAMFGDDPGYEPDQDDLAVANILRGAPSPDPLPPELKLLDDMLLLSGFHLELCNGHYSLIGPGGGALITNSDVNALLNSAKDYLAFQAHKLIVEGTPFEGIPPRAPSK